MIQYGYHFCPGCGADLDGGMIPVERRKLFGGVDRYSKLIHCPVIPDDPTEYLLCSGCMMHIPVLATDAIQR